MIGVVVAVSTVAGKVKGGGFGRTDIEGAGISLGLVNVLGISVLVVGDITTSGVNITALPA